MTSPNPIIGKLKARIESLGVTATIEELKPQFEGIDLVLSVKLQKDGYSWGFEYVISLMLTQTQSDIDNLAMAWVVQFDRNQRRHIAREKYFKLSKDARAAFRLICQENYLDFSYFSDKALVAELVDGGLCEQISPDPVNFGYTLKPSSDARYLYAEF